MLSEMTSTVSSVFLGLTIGCAQCHNHKYDRIPTSDFYRLKAFFSTVQIERPLPGDIYQIGAPLPASFYRKGEKEWATKLSEQRNADLAEARSLVAALEKVEDAGKKSTPKIPLTAELRAQREKAKTRVRLLEQELKRLQPVAMSLRHSYGPPFEPGVPETRVLIRGEWDKPGEVVEPGFPRVITGHQDPAPIRLDPFKRWPTRSRRLGARDGQSALGLALRARPRGYAERFRQTQRRRLAPGIDRLAGAAVHRFQLERQGHAPADPQLRHLSPVLPASRS
jgi:hypothetical protein